MRLAVLLLALVACRDETVTIRAPSEGADYNRAALTAAIDAYLAAGRTPPAYRQLALTIDGLRAGFDETTAETAELNLVLLARAPIDTLAAQPIEAQVEGLALTVWPTAIEVAPIADEAPRAYLLRLCAGTLANVCKHVVPEHQGAVIAGLVAERLSDRARDAVAKCLLCAGDPAYAEAVKAFVEASGAATARALRAEAAGAPTRWPAAGDAAQPWPEVPLLVLDDTGRATLDGVALTGGVWRPAMKAARATAAGRAGALGVSLPPGDRVDTLRAVIADAAASGFTSVALLTRAPAYPYEQRAYRIAAGRAGRDDVRVPARDIDTIQVLVQSLDAHARGDALARL